MPLGVLALLPFLGGCINAVDPLWLAMLGPRTISELVAARPIGPGDRLALLVMNPGEDAHALGACVVGGLRTHLRDRPPIVELTASERVRASIADEGLPRALPAASAQLGTEWLIVVTDRSVARLEQSSFSDLFGEHGLGLAHVTGTQYTLRLHGQLFDLRNADSLGVVTATFDTHGRSGLAVGIVGVPLSLAYPVALPIVHFPAGRNALAICDAFGRALADGLLRASGATLMPTSIGPSPAVRTVGR